MFFYQIFFTQMSHLRTYCLLAYLCVASARTWSYQGQSFSGSLNQTSTDDLSGLCDDGVLSVRCALCSIWAVRSVRLRASPVTPVRCSQAIRRIFQDRRHKEC